MPIKPERGQKTENGRVAIIRSACRMHVVWAVINISLLFLFNFYSNSCNGSFYNLRNI